jgi:hypothetical protein
MKLKWDRAAALLGGTDTMRAAAQTLLPKYEAEPEAEWKVRKDRAVLTNFYKSMLDAMVGHVFSSPVQLIDSKLNDEFVDDIDKQGNGINRFARQMFHSAMQHGYCHGFVNYPQVDPDATEADEIAANVRPYWMCIAPENMIDVHTIMTDGAEIITMARWFETSVVQVGFTQAVVTRIHVMEIGKYSVYLRNADTKQWELESDGDVSLPYIPLRTIYLQKKGNLLSDPPLDGVAHLNVEHWQSASDQRNILTLSRFAMLAQSGGDKAVGLTSGPRTVLHMEDANGKFYYVEPKGEGIGAGERDLERIKEDAQLMGFDLMSEKPGAETATGRLIDSVRITSPLQDMGMALEDGLNDMLRMTADWLDKPHEWVGKAKVNDDFGFTTDEKAMLEHLQKARTNGDITQKTYLQILQEKGVLSEDLDIDAEIEATEEEDGKLGLTNGFAAQFTPGATPEVDAIEGPDDADDE